MLGRYPAGVAGVARARDVLVAKWCQGTCGTLQCLGSLGGGSRKSGQMFAAVHLNIDI